MKTHSIDEKWLPLAVICSDIKRRSNEIKTESVSIPIRIGWMWKYIQFSTELFNALANIGDKADNEEVKCKKTKIVDDPDGNLKSIKTCCVNFWYSMAKLEKDGIDVAPIDFFEGKWWICHELNPKVLSPIKFCPWCGTRLKHINKMTN